MKLTKSKLNQIIKEELTIVLKKDLTSLPPEVQMSMKKQNRYLQQVRNSGKDPWDHLDEVLAHLQEKHPELADEIANWYYLYME